MRGSEVPIFQGDRTRFTEATGWEPKFPIDETLKTILDYWRDQVR
jgi:nucleoside-diphosphate-sugar epimerase